MSNTEPKIATLSISYIGDSVHATLKAHDDVVRAVGDLCSGMTDATIKVHVSTRATAHEKLIWPVKVSSPMGLRNLLATQRRAGDPVRFSNE